LSPAAAGQVGTRASGRRAGDLETPDIDDAAIPSTPHPLRLLGIDALASAKPVVTALGSVVGLVAASASLSALRERRERSGDEAEGGSQ